VTTNPRRQAKDALYDGIAGIAGALASGRRAEILELLAQGERTVDQVAEEIGQSTANTSHHLRTLARAGLLTSRRDGTYVHYAIASDAVLRAWWAIRALAKAHLGDHDLLAEAYLGPRDELQTVSREEVHSRLHRGDVVIIDVRPRAEFDAGHIPGAISIPPDRLDDLLDTLPPDRDVIAYCRGPYCVYADDAVRQLRRRGRHALRLEDGLPEWRHAGGRVEPRDHASAHG
jgi:rhodanese-related sulfurtransferase